MSNSMINSLNTISTKNSINSNQKIEIVSPSEIGALGKNDFLNMILTQLQNQDPLNPLDNAEFASQLAQFSTLEQLTNMNEQLNSLGEISKKLEEILTVVKKETSTDKTNEVDKNVANNPVKDSQTDEVTIRYDFTDNESSDISKLLSTQKFKQIYSI